MPAEIVTFPESLLKISELQMNIVTQALQSPTSPFNQYTRVSGPLSRFWRCQMTVSPLGNADHRDLEGFLAYLDNGFVKCRLYKKGSEELIGAGASGNLCNVDAATAAGSLTLPLRNLIADQSPALARGDCIGIGENLHLVVSDAISNGSGEASVSIRPATRKGVGEGDVVNLYRPTGLFKLVSGADTLPVVSPIRSRQFTLNWFEDPDID